MKKIIITLTVATVMGLLLLIKGIHFLMNLFNGDLS